MLSPMPINGAEKLSTMIDDRSNILNSQDTDQDGENQIHSRFQKTKLASEFIFRLNFAVQRTTYSLSIKIDWKALMER